MTVRQLPTLASALESLEPSEPLCGLLEGLLASGEPENVREADMALHAVLEAERAVAGQLRRVEARSEVWHRLMLASEAIARHAARTEAAARALGAQAA